MKKKMTTYILTGALTLGAAGAVALPAFASEASTDSTDATGSTTSTDSSELSFERWGGDELSDATKEKIQSIIDQMKAELAELGVTLPERPERAEVKDMFADLAEETQAQAEAIFQQVKDGTITREEAKTQLEALGITLPERGDHGNKADLFADLDEETQTQAEAIMEDAKEQMEELGVEMPEKGHRGGHGGMHHGQESSDSSETSETEAAAETQPAE